MVRCNQYSVPARFIGHRLRVKLSASALTAYDRASVVARHQRAVGKGAKVLGLDHIWRSCTARPARCPTRPLRRRPARPRCFTTEHDAFWAAARAKPTGTPRALVEVLVLHRHLDRADVLAGITASLAVKST